MELTGFTAAIQRITFNSRRAETTHGICEAVEMKDYKILLAWSIFVIAFFMDLLCGNNPNKYFLRAKT